MSPHVWRFLSIFQTKANGQVGLIKFGGPGDTSEPRGPAPAAKPARAGAKADAHVKRRLPPWRPGSRGSARSRGCGPGSASGVSPAQACDSDRCCGPSEPAGGRERGARGRRGPWQCLKPKVKSESLRLAGSCSGLPAVSISLR